MPKARLTKSSIEKLTMIEGKQTDYFDTKLTGFGVRVNSRSSTYFVQGRIKKAMVDEATREVKKNPPFKETIGPTNIIPFEIAFEKAKRILEDAEQGVSPKDRQKERDALEEERQRLARIEEGRDITLGEIKAEYFTVKKHLKRRTREDYAQVLETHVPDWLSTPIRNITWKMCVDRHAEIGARSPSQADKVMRVVRALFMYAIEAHEDVVYKNPVKRLSTLKAWYGLKRKTSFIPQTKLKDWLKAVLALDNVDARDALLLGIFTGARRDEVFTLEWDDISFIYQSCVFRETKNSDPLEIPLSQYMLDMLSTRKEESREKYVFSGRKKGDHLRDVRHQIDIVSKACGHDFTFHDLRRTFLTYCNILKVPVWVQKRLANHAMPTDVTEGYVQHTIEDLRPYVEQVAKFILTHAGIIDGGKVVSLEEKRKRG